jgi:hypothetical protein
LLHLTRANAEKPYAGDTDVLYHFEEKFAKFFTDFLVNKVRPG